MLEPTTVTSVHATRAEAIGQCAAELAAEGGGEMLVHDETCAGAAEGVACSCTPAVHVIPKPERA